MMTATKQQIYTRAMEYIASAIPALAAAPTLYGPDNRPIVPSPLKYATTAAGNAGSMRNWNPRVLRMEEQFVRERETINARVSEQVANDPHAAGAVNIFPVTVVGAGLQPYPTIDADMLGVTEAQAAAVEAAQRLVFVRWNPHASVCGRMDFGAVQFLWERSLMMFGEALTLVHWIPRPGGYGLTLRVIHPNRMKTPSDKRRLGSIFDGVEIDRHGRPVAVWIKRADPVRMLSDASANFARIPVAAGHRFRVLHDFVTEDPEQYRGTSPLAPMLKGFKDLSELFDAELVSNVVTAAFAMFIEVQAGASPLDVAGNLQSFYDTRQQPEKTQYERYQEMIPGSIMYGNRGEKPHPIAAARPGVTFQPFIREIRKSFAHGLGLAYPVAFHDTDGVSFAGFRSAMLESWRVFSWHRNRLGSGPSAKVWRMLQEEAYLAGDLPIPGPAADFYRNLDAWCACSWYGAPKGDIEPYAAVKADLLAFDGNIKPMERIILEHGSGNPAAVTRQIEREKKDLAARGMLSAKSQAGKDPEITAAAAEAIAMAVRDEMEKHNGS